MYTEQLLLENTIKAFIQQNKIEPFSKFPSERTLSDELGVSRLQVRRILQSLVDQGILIVKKNSGYYLAPPKISVLLNSRNSYFNPICNNEKKFTRFITINKLQFNNKIANILDCKQNTGIELIGLQIQNNIPYGVIFSYFGDYENVSNNGNIFIKRNLFDTFALHGNPIAHMTEELSTKNSSKFEEILLNLPPDSKLTKHEIYCYNEQGLCILYQVILYPIFLVEFKGWSL